MKHVVRLFFVSACLLAQPVAPSAADDEHTCGSVTVSPALVSQDASRFNIRLTVDATSGKDNDTEKKVRVQTLLKVTFKSSDGSLGHEVYEAQSETPFGRVAARGQGLKRTHRAEKIVAIAVQAARCCSPTRPCPPLEFTNLPTIYCR